MTTIQLSEVKKIWQKISKFSTQGQKGVVMEIQHKLLDLFHTGDFYYYILHVPSAHIELVSDAMTAILGYEPHEFSVEHLLAAMHPDDLPYFLQFEQKVQEFFNELSAEKVLKYKVSYDFRIKSKQGNYLRLLHQVATIQINEEGGGNRVIGIHTDITNLKKENGSSLSFIGLDGEESYRDVLRAKTADSDRLEIQGLSKREHQILTYILQGKTSMQIADILFISRFTVDTHRRNILAKTNCRNTNELALKCLREVNYR
jgi:PAS domain S-box-containing protein